jgi:hypothetical protein
MNLVVEASKLALRLALLITFAALVSACGGEREDANQALPKSTETVPADQASGPKVTVTADKTHAVQPSDEITVTVTVDGFTLDAEKIEPNVGRYRVYLDDASGEDFLAESAAESVKVTIPDSITDGSHELRVVLHHNDGTPVEPLAQGDVWLIVYRL